MIPQNHKTATAIIVLVVAFALTTPAFAQLPVPELPPSVPVEVPFTGAQTVYAEDFELDDGGWAKSEVPPPPPRPAPVNPDWEWGAPTSGPGEAASGTNVWALKLDGFYRVPQCAAIMSPVIDLSAATSASVSFQHWVHMDTATTIAFHGGLLMVTPDGGDTLTTVTPQGGYTSVGLGTSARACLDAAPTGQQGYSGGPSSGYSGVDVDLSAFAGQAIQFVLGFGTDGVGTAFNGWYVDDFAVTIDGVTSVEDFESSDGGFTVVSTALPGAPQRGWDWAQPTSGPDHIGNVWATNPHGSHGHGECHWAESPAFRLGEIPAGPGGVLGNTPVTTAQLSWLQFFRTSALIGQGVVQVGTADGAYHLVTPDGGYDRAVHAELAGCLGTSVNVYAGARNPVGGPMTLQSADLTAWLGEEITLRFLFASRASGTTMDGWYIDDVKVDLGAGAYVRIGVPNLPGSPDAPFTRVSTVYAEDFEGSDGGWVETGTGEWDWGTPAPPPIPPSGSFNMWGTDTRGDHGTNACSWITSPPISLPGVPLSGPVDLALLELDLFVDTTNRHDGAIVEVSADGGATWEYVTPNEGYDNTLLASSGGPTLDCLGLSTTQGVWTGPAADAEEWRSFSADLTPFMGSDVLLRLGFGSNANDDGRRGVYVDRVVVSLGVGADTSLPDPSGLGIVAPGWDVTGENPSWLYGLPTSGPASLRPTWATGLHGPYNSGECSAIESRAVDTSLIPGLGRLELSFSHSFNTPLTTHAGVIQVSRDDGDTWDLVTPIGGYPQALGVAPRDCLTPGQTGTRGYASSATDGYESAAVPLRDYEDETIRVRFAFHSTSTTNLGDGWYLRDIGLTRGLGTIPLEGPGSTPMPLGAPHEEPLLRDVADGELLRLFELGEVGPVDVIVSGPAHMDVAAQSFDTRAEWTAWFDEEAGPFFQAVEQTVGRLGGEVSNTWSAVPAVKVSAPLATILALPAHAGAQHMVTDHDERVFLIDPFEGDPVGTMNSGGRQQVEAEQAWALGYMGEGIRIAIIDTGIDATHEALKFADGSTRLVGFANCIGISGCNGAAAPFDDHGHGTHVGATAAGSDLYEDPVWGKFQEVGVAPRAEILGVKFLNSGGSGSLNDALDALQWSFDNDADLTSNSWGSTCTSASVPTLTKVNNLALAGMLSVTSAGNSGPSAGTIGSPACADRALSVGAVDQNEVIASFSSRGPCSDPSTGSASRICPDVVAKGVDVRSAIPRSGASWADASGYRVWSGTSMSGPHVAGVVAIAEQMKRDLTGTGWDVPAGAVHEVLGMTAKPIGSPVPNNIYGWGIPQLMAIYALLDSTDEANIVSTFSVGADELWLGDSTPLSFSVQNLGGATATGEFEATLTDPTGAVTVLDSDTVSLSLLDRKSMSDVFHVLEDVLPGQYSFTGTFAYTWEDPDGGLVTDLIEHVGNFTVNRVFIEFEIEGFAPQTTFLSLQAVTVAMSNTGNEAGQNVRLEFTVPDAYEFMPPTLLGLLDPDGYYSDPAPDSVHYDEHFGRTTLTYNVGNLDVDETFSVALYLLPLETGTHWVRAVGKFQDGAGTTGLQSKLAAQTVDLI